MLQKRYRSIAVALSLMLLPTTTLHAQQPEDKPLSATSSTLIGSVIAGAISAHPVGLIAGGISGYFVNKYQQYNYAEQEPISAPKDTRQQAAPTPEQLIPEGKSQRAVAVVATTKQKSCFGSRPEMSASAPAGGVTSSSFTLIEGLEESSTAAAPSPYRSINCFYYMN